MILSIGFFGEEACVILTLIIVLKVRIFGNQSSIKVYTKVFVHGFLHERNMDTLDDSTMLYDLDTCYSAQYKIIKF